jgi:peptide/nickel transport system substrate-binding protein
MRVRRGAPLPPASSALMRQFEKYVMDDQAHELMTLWWYRIVPSRSYVKGWHISPSHFLGNSLAAVWLDQ